MKRTATAKWQGNLKQGQGMLTTESASLSNSPYSCAKRFENEGGTNPEELIAAAHAGCFAMAMSAELEKMNLKGSIDVEAEVVLDKISNEWAIPEVHLKMSANVPGASANQIDEAANRAKNNCPVSKLLKANITLESDKLSQSA